MLKKAHEWQLLSSVPVVKLVEEHGREELVDPCMEQLLLTVTAGPRLTPKGKKSRVGWEPFRTILLIMLDSGLRPGEIFRGMRERRMGLPVEESPVWAYHRPRGFETMARSQAVGRCSRIGRFVLCSPSFLNRRNGGNRKRDGGHGCDGASIGQHHAHL